MAKTRTNGLSSLLILFVLGYGAFFFRNTIGKFFEGAPPVLTDSLKGFPSPKELDSHLNEAIRLAVANNAMQNDWWASAIIIATTAVMFVATIAVCINYGIKTLSAKKAGRKFDAHKHFLCMFGALFLGSLICGILYPMDFYGIGPIYQLIANKNSIPAVVTPGVRVIAEIDPSSPIKAIQGRYWFEKFEVVNFKALPHSGDEILGNFSEAYPCASSSARNTSKTVCERQSGTREPWNDFSKFLGEIFVKSLGVSIALPDDIAMAGSLATGGVRAGLQFPVWISPDRSGAQSQTIEGKFSFWVASKPQADFAYAVQSRRNNPAIIIAWIGVLICLGFMFNCAVDYYQYGRSRTATTPAAPA